MSNCVSERNWNYWVHPKCTKKNNMWVLFWRILYYEKHLLDLFLIEFANFDFSFIDSNTQNTLKLKIIHIYISFFFWVRLSPQNLPHSSIKLHLSPSLDIFDTIFLCHNNFSHFIRLLNARNNALDSLVVLHVSLSNLFLYVWLRLVFRVNTLILFWLKYDKERFNAYSKLADHSLGDICHLPGN